MIVVLMENLELFLQDLHNFTLMQPNRTDDVLMRGH